MSVYALAGIALARNVTFDRSDRFDARPVQAVVSQFEGIAVVGEIILR